MLNVVILSVVMLNVVAHLDERIEIDYIYSTIT
jgi:hypothetical protein